MPRSKFCSSPSRCAFAPPALQICGFRRGWLDGLALSRFGDEAPRRCAFPGADPDRFGAVAWPQAVAAQAARVAHGRAGQKPAQGAPGGRPRGVGAARAKGAPSAPPPAPVPLRPCGSSPRSRSQHLDASRPLPRFEGPRCTTLAGSAPHTRMAVRSRWRHSILPREASSGYASMAANLEPHPFEAGGFRA
jgi:hypothetical protein